MSSTMRSAVSTRPDNSLPATTQSMARAELRPSAPASDLSVLIKDTAKRVHGKQATAAAVVGKAESNFSRDVDAGALRTGDLERLGPQFLAALGKELVEQYAPLATPHARALAQVKVARQALDELEQAIEQFE